MIFIFSLNRMLICMDAKVMYIVHQALCEFVQIHELGPELLADARSRLIAGLKRYFHAKRLEGLLSAKVIHGLVSWYLGVHLDDLFREHVHFQSRGSRCPQNGQPVIYCVLMACLTSDLAVVHVLVKRNSVIL
jgi:hypothetical protein